MRKVVFFIFFLVCFPLVAEDGGENKKVDEGGDFKKIIKAVDGEDPLSVKLPSVNVFKIRFRMGWSKFSFTTTSDSDTFISWDMGVSVNIPLSYQFSIETGVVSELNIHVNDANDQGSMWYQFKVPVLGKFYYSNSASFGAFFQLGLMYSFAPGALVDSVADSFDNFISLVIGTGVDFGTTSLDLRLVLGLGKFFPGQRKTALEFGVTF